MDSSRSRAERAARKRKVTRARFWPAWRYSLRWDEIDCVSGQGGHGLIEGLRIWWQVRTGRWYDDDPLPLWFDDGELADPSCVVKPTSSAVCSLGTKSCEEAHD